MYANYTVCASVFIHFCMQRKNNENIPILNKPCMTKDQNLSCKFYCYQGHPCFTNMSCFRSALEDVRICLQEKSQRWNNIEKLCGFPIISNPGKDKLVQVLERDLGKSSNGKSV